MHEKVLLVDDEQELLELLQSSLEREGYTVHTALSGEQAWTALCETMYDCIVCDLAMEPMDGLDLLRQVRAIDNLLPFIIMTGAGSIETAVEAIQLGAYHYITKPLNTRELLLLLNRAVEHGKLQRKLDSVGTRQAFDADEMIIGNNTLIQQMIQIVDKVSESDASILIQGETGTGKSIFAKRIHNSSSRQDKPFYTIDCGALSEPLLESELFGHVKGAFTGAVCAKRGLLEEARGGTIFLDEIGELTPATQVKLLRAVQEKVIKPVGGNTTITIDVRFISATSSDLDQGIGNDTFRKDLYYRLAVIPLYLPPLRERRDDLLLFVDHFVRTFNAKYKKNITLLSPSAIQMLMESPWEGNIRELENIIERAVLLTRGDTISLNAVSIDTRPFAPEPDSPQNPVSLKRMIQQTELAAISHALDVAGGNKSRAAQILGITRRTLYQKIELYDL